MYGRYRLAWQAAPLVACLDASRSHQTRYPVDRAGLPGCLQIMQNARRTICSVTGDKAGTNANNQLRIGLLPLTLRPFKPVIKTTGRYPQNPAHCARRPYAAVASNKAVLHLGSIAK